eukprot:Rhum_TRINITY_DN11679_c0_g1::Rhum_TRINITY_DN11679_c0_g1_i1::g.46083::m.46083
MDSVLIVTNALDGRRYRLVIKGNLRRITGAKVKKYMVSHVGAGASSMVLKFGGREMYDTTTAGELGVQSGDTIVLEPLGPGASPPPHAPPSVSATSTLHHAQLLEAESLDDQRGLFEVETGKRQQEYARTINEIANEMTERERQANQLEDELKERQLQVKRLEQERMEAMSEKRRLEDLRELELRKQREREDELKRREAQLLAESERHRELELKRMEVEKRQKLIEQQRMEAQLEKERVERDRREYEENIRKQEEEIRKREQEQERAQYEHQRRQRELERDRAQLATQRAFESQTFGREQELDDLRLAEIQGADPAEGRKPLDLQVARLHANDKRAAAHESWSGLSAPTVGGGHTPGGGPGGAAASGVLGRQPPAHIPPHSARSNALSSPGFHAPPPHHDMDCDALAAANLSDLAHHLGQPLSFDESNTCVVDVDEKHTIMISYDKETEGLYVYSSLLCNLPRDPTLKLQLYEMLLEGALLGRDMAGGGVGLSLKDDFVLMCSSIPLRSCYPHALRLAVPAFSDALRKWRKRIKEVLTEQHSQDRDPLPHAAPAGPPPSAEYGGGGGGGHVHVGEPWPHRAEQHPPTNSPSAPSAVHNPPSTQTVSDQGEESYAVIGVELTDGVTIDGVHTQYNNGVIVVRVKGPAAAAGMLENDIIKIVNGRHVTSLQAFQDITAGLVPDVPCIFVIERDGHEISVEIRPTRGFRRPGEQRRYRVPEEVLRSAQR